jgi:hypothetical protein
LSGSRILMVFFVGDGETFMAMTDKEAAVQTIRNLPDDAPMDVILEVMKTLANSDERHGASATSVSPDHTFDERQDGADGPVSYHLEHRGWATVLVPDGPAPPITTEMINALIEKARREREDRWLGLTEEDDA